MNGQWIAALGARPARRDALLAGVWATLGIALWTFGAHGLWKRIAVVEAPSWIFLVTLAVAVAAVTRRSRAPFTALLVGAAATAIDLACGGSLGTVLAFTDLIYAAVKYGDERRLRLALRVGGAIALVVVVALLLIPTPPGVASATLQWALIVLVSALWGWNVRSEGERTRLALTAEHALETEQLRDRIAHELHDLVANQIAVAGLHIEAAKLQSERLTGGAPLLERSLDRAKRGTDEAHRELRGLISVLTAVDELGAVEVPESAHGIAGLDERLPIGRELEWEPGSRIALETALRAEPGSRSRVLMRVLHELVANAAKHGRGRAAVRVIVANGALRIEIRNVAGGGEATGWGGSTIGSGAGNGLGIGGARLLMGGIGGELVSERASGTWVAALGLPLTATVPRPTAMTA